MTNPAVIHARPAPCVEPVHAGARHDRCPHRRDATPPYWRYLERQNEVPPEVRRRRADEFVREAQPGARAPEPARPRPEAARIADVTPVAPRPQGGPARESVVIRRSTGTGRLIDIVV